MAMERIAAVIAACRRYRAADLGAFEPACLARLNPTGEAGLFCAVAGFPAPQRGFTRQMFMAAAYQGGFRLFWAPRYDALLAEHAVAPRIDEGWPQDEEVRVGRITEEEGVRLANAGVASIDVSPEV